MNQATLQTGNAPALGRDHVAARSRFLALALLIRRYGDPIRVWIEQRLGLIAALAAGLLVLLYLALRYGLGGGGGYPC